MSRRSARERKKPDSIYDEAKRAADARGEEDEEGSDEEEPEVPREDESDEDETPPIQRKSPGGQKRKSADAQLRPPRGKANKRVKAGGPRKSGQGTKKKPDDDSEAESEDGRDEAEEDEDSLEAVMGSKAKRKKAAGGGSRRRSAVVKGEGVARRGKAKQASVSLDDLDEATHSLLYERVSRGMPVENLLENLITKFEEDSASENEVRGTIFDFLVWSSGGTRNVVGQGNGLPSEGSDEWEELVEGMVEEMRQGGIETYPLEMAKPAFKKFRSAFTQMWNEMVLACRSGDGYHMDFLSAMVDMLTVRESEQTQRALSMASFVAIRHTATFGALCLADALVKEVKLLAEKERTHNRQLDAEISKAGTKSRKAQGLHQQIENVTSRISSLEDLLKLIFDGVFTHRYRDCNMREESSDDQRLTDKFLKAEAGDSAEWLDFSFTRSSELTTVRSDCMESLGALLEFYPQMFLKDQTVKYLGWTLYDKVPSVRLSAVEVLDKVYSQENAMDAMANFTTRFLGRLTEMIQDVSDEVQVPVIRILRKLHKAGQLDDTTQEVLDEVDAKLLDVRKGPALREQAMLFFTEHAGNFNEEQEEDDDDDLAPAAKGRNKKKKKSTGATVTAKRQVSRAQIANRITSVVHLLDYHLKEDYHLGMDHIRTCVSSFEMHPEGGFIFDWSTYFDLLKGDKGFTDQEQSILIALLVAAVEHAAKEADQAEAKGGRGRGGKKAEQREVRVQEALEAFTAGAVETLPKLLEAFQTNAEKTAWLAKLPQYFQPHSIESKRNKGNFTALLKLLRDIYVKAINDKVLSVTVTSLRHLLTNDTQKHLQVHDGIRRLCPLETATFIVDVTIRQLAQSLVERLQQCLAPAQEATGRGTKRRASQGSSQGTPSSQDQDQDKEYSLGLALMQLRYLAMQIDLEDYTDTMELATLIQDAVSERVDLTSWPVEEQLQSRMKVIEESMQALFIMLTRAFKTFVDQTSEKYPVKADADGEGDEEEEDGEDAVDAAPDELREKVLAMRTGLIEVTCAILATEVKADSDMSRKRTRLLSNMLQELQGSAFKIVSELRFMFRPRLEGFKGLGKMVWVPDPDFLRLLQSYFKNREALYDAADEDPEVDEALVENLLDPLMRSVLYTTEALNRRQAAAAAVHFVHSGTQSAETVKWFMKQLKTYDPRLHLEVQMSTLRSFYSRYVVGEESGEKDGLTKFGHLAQRLAQSMGVGRVSHESADSFMRFLTTGINVAFEEAPKSFTFLKGLNYYATRIMEEKRAALVELFDSKVESLPEDLQDELRSLLPKLEDEEERETISTAWLSFFYFQQELKGPLKITLGPTTKKRKTSGGASAANRKRHEEGEEEEEDMDEKEFGDIEGVIGKASSTIRESVGSRKRRSKAKASWDKEEADAVMEEDDIEEMDDGEDDEEQPRAFHQPVRTGRPSGRSSSSRGASGSRRSSSRASKLPALSEDELDEDDVEDFEEEDKYGGGKVKSSGGATKMGKMRMTRSPTNTSTPGNKNRSRAETPDQETGGMEDDRRSVGSATSSNYSLFGEMGPPKPAAQGNGKAKATKPKGKRSSG